MKVGIVTFLGVAGLVVLVIGLVTLRYLLNLAIVLTVIIWIAAALFYVLVREIKTGRRITKAITDSGCREATKRLQT